MRPFSLPALAGRRNTPKAKIAAAVAVSQVTRQTPPVTLASVGGDYSYRDGTLFLSGEARPTWRAC